MTKREFQRRAHQEGALVSLGFTWQEAEALRRISMTLHRWHELECGDSSEHASWCITRGSKGPRNAEGKREFIHDEAGRPFMERHIHTENAARYSAIPDREKGALKRLNAIVARRNNTQNAIGAAFQHPAGRLSYYVQTDPRGAALYIIRPGDVPQGEDVSAYYSRGICVY